MEKIKKWRRFALALFSLLFVGILSFALVQIIPARADDKVLTENTATYHFVNDTSYTEGYDTLWKYTRSSNIWQSSYETAQKRIETTLTLEILTDGDVAFQWQIAAWSDNPDRVAYFKVMKVTGEQETSAYEKNPVTTDNNKKYSETVTIPVKKDDKLKFVVKSNYGSNAGYFQIKGLNIPTETFNVVAEVAQDSIGNGSIKTDKTEETFAENKITAVRGYNEKITFTAVPNDGYVAYWTRNDAYFKATNAFDEYVSDDSAKTPFIVHFVKSDSEEILISYDKPSDSEMGWKEDSAGSYSIANVVENVGATTFNEKILSFGFVGEKWISLDCLLDIEDASNMMVSPYLDGSSYYYLSLRQGTKGQANLLGAHITGSGFHYLEFHLHPSGALSSSDITYDIKGTERVTLSNFVFSKTKLETEMSVKYNSDFAELYLDGQLCDAGDATGMITQTISVPLAGAFNLEARPKIDIISSLDETKTTTSQFIEGTVNGTYSIYNRDEGKYDIFTPAFEADAKNIVKFTITRNSPIAFTINTKQKGTDSSISLTLNGGESKLELDLTYKEIAVAPNVSATKTSDGDEIGDYESIEGGQFLGFPFRHENSLSLRIQKLMGFEAADYSIVANMVEMNESLTNVGDVFILPMIVNSNTEVTISFTKEDTDLVVYSSYNLTFNVGENPKGEDVDDTEISHILHVSAEEAGEGSLTIGQYDVIVYDIENKYGNANAGPWKFDAALSEEGNYAYTTTLDFEKTGSGYYRPKTAVKALGFELSGADKGSLSFQFKVNGYNNFTDISGAYRGGLLGAYTNEELQSANVMGLPFSSEKIKNICYAQDAINYTDPKAGILLAKPGSNGAMEYGGNVIAMGDGWCQASIPVTKSTRGACINLVFITCYDGLAAYPLESLPSASFSIRDVHLITGDQSATLSVCTEAGEATVTAKVGELEYHAGSSFTAAAGSTVDLSVDTQGKHFYGWTVNGSLVSTEESTKIFLNGKSDIKAWIADEGTYEARAEGTFYKTVKEAVGNATSGQTVYIIKDYVTINESFEIKTGVTLLLPYSKENRLTATGTPDDVNSKNRIAWIADSGTYRYLTVTVKGTATITVNGTLAVGGVVNYPKGQGYQGHTSGAYSELILEKGSKIQVASGGVMDVYGRVWGGVGKTGSDMGTIDVASGGVVYEPFLILDFTGGSDALGSFTAQKTPFKRYAMINIEVPMTINYGGKLFGHASLWVETMRLLASLDQPFITDEKGDGNGSDTFVMLHKGASVTITYDSAKTVNNATVGNCTEGIGKTTMTFEGGATFSYMKFSAMGLTVPTNVVYFSIPYNFNVSLNKGEKTGDEIDSKTYNQYETVTDFIIMPGAVVTVGEGATLTLNANAWVYDGLKQPVLHSKWYPTAEELSASGYSKSGNLIVNGTLKTGMKKPVPPFELFASDDDFDDTPIPATFLGIVQTNDSGRIEILAGATVKGTISDGIEGQNYFAYTTTARVWDAAHGCFGDLEAGHTYTATSGTAFTLETLNYTNTEGGAENLTLTLSSDMVGSWKVEHTEHHEPVWEYGKTYGAAADGTTEENGHTQLTRYCTELGCDHQFHKELLGTPNAGSAGLLGGLTFKGSPFKDEDLEALFKRNYKGFNFTLEGGGTVTVTAAGGDLASAQTVGDSYKITITLKNGFFLEGDAFIPSMEFTWKIVPFDLSVDFGKDDANASATLEHNSVEYNGQKQEVAVQQVMAYLTSGSGTGLNAKSDYTVSYDGQDTTNAGTVTVTIKGTGNYTGEIKLTYQITKKALEVTIDNASHTYGETPQEAFTVTVSGEVEGQTADIKAAFTLTAADATQWANVGHYAITAAYNANDGVLKNYAVNVTNAKNTAYEITAKDIADIEVEFTKTYTYDRKAQQPLADDLTVTLAGYEGEHAVTFTVGGYQNNIDAGSEASLVVTGTDNFTGTKTVTFTIEKATIDKVTVDGSYTYNAEDQTDSVKSKLTVNAGSLTLSADEYTVTFAKGEENTVKNAGTYTVTVTTTDKNFKTTNAVTAEFTVAQAQVTVTAENKNSPEGQALVGLTYTIAGYFEDDTDLRAALKISVAEDAKTGKVDQKFAITVAFKETEGANAFPNYTFEFEEGTYKITAAVFANVTFASGSAVYNREAHKHTATLGQPADKKGTFDEKYTYAIKGGASVAEMKDAGIYTVTLELTFTVSESEKYTTTLTSEYTITAAQIGEVTVHEGDFTYTGKEIAPTLTVKSANNLTLSTEEYTVSYGAHGNVNAGTVEVTVAPNSTNFAGSGSATFLIKTKDIGGAEVAVTKDYTYCGREIVPAQGDVTVTLAGFEVTFGISANNNIDAGKDAVVTVTGTGNYSGTATANFTIKAKDITVNILGQTFTYSGTEKFVLDDSKWTTTGLETRDNPESLHVTLSLAKSERWNVGTHEDVIEGAWNNGNYNVTFVKGDLTVTARAVTVTVADKSSEYGDSYAELTYTVNKETPLAKGDEEEALGITLTFAGSEGSVLLTPNTYLITGKASPVSGNYAVTFQNEDGDTASAVYTVTKRHITVTIQNQTKTYNNEEFSVPQAENEGWKVTENTVVGGDELGITLTKALGKDVHEYVISGEATNSNYDVTFIEGTFTIERRAVTVTVADQSADYDYLYEYAKDGSAWTVEAEALAQGEDRDDLQITLDFGVITTAGTYPIRGECANNNYAVTFRGSMEDRGTYTVNKKDLSEGRAIFRLSSGDKTSGNYMLTVALSSEFIDLDSSASVFEGTTPKTLQTTVTPSRLTEVGTHKVQIEIVDDNYCGGAEFTVIVTYANGYTERLQTTMQRLRELAEGKSADALKEEDFDDLKEMATLLAALNAEERGLAADDLEKYDDLVNAWNDLADLDGIIETAEAVASAPLSGLFGAISTLTALAALAFVVTKGGLL